MKLIQMEKADLKISSDATSTIVSSELGSTVAITFYDPAKLIGGILHFLLPSSSVSLIKARSKPALFADTGISAALQKLSELGCKKEDLQVKVVGAGSLMDITEDFNLAPRNIEACLKILEENGIKVLGQDVGENKSRVVKLEIANGKLTVQSFGMENVL